MDEKTKKKESQRIRLKGQLRMYMQWPLILGALLVVAAVLCLIIDRQAGMVVLVCLLIYFIFAIVLYFYSRSKIMKDLVGFASQYSTVQNTLLQELSVPYAILLENGQALWMNDEFREVLGDDATGDDPVSTYIPELNTSIFPKGNGDVVTIDVYCGAKEYNAELSKVSVEEFNASENLIELPEGEEYFIAVSLVDVTELNEYIRLNEQQRMVAGLIYIDNYEEVMNSVEEVRQSLLMALVDRRVNQYIAKADGIVKKVENDKYFIALQKQSFQELESDKFSLLDDVKAVNIGNGIPVTISIGLGLSSESYAQSYNYARAAIDLALARGGDQAVIKDCNGITYYGGKREQTVRNTRVKARVKAEALREYITVKDKIFVMGHKITDVDSFGAAIGIYRACAALGKQAHIVVNDVSMSLRPLYDSYRNNPDYPDDLLLTSEQAMEMADDNSMVVVVDANRPQMTECEDLLQVTKTIIVLDHHRQSSDSINYALLSYIEPYASSACEMVAEVLQYITDDIKIPSMEASTMYAGIVMDTNNFTNRTGVRTFEAAAFLRRCGADITQVRKMFRDDMDSYRAKAQVISKAEIYRERFAFAEGKDLQVESPTIVGAQAANELLDISHVKASFVFTEYNGRIYVSARSIDEVNVQLIMERVGGGGHMNAAGAQFDNTEIDKAVQAVKDVIDLMIEEGDL